MATRKKAPPTVQAPQIMGGTEMESLQDREPANSRKRPAARGTAFYPRKRANAACQVCRARKTKCDNQKPTCSYCLGVGAVCNQTAEDLSSFDPASLKILERLDVLERLMRQQGIQPTTSLESTLSLAQQQGHNSASARSDQNTLASSAPRGNPPLLRALPESPDRLLCLGVLQKYRFNAGFTNKDSGGCHWAEKPTQKRCIPTTRALRGGRLLDNNIRERRRVNELLDGFFTFVHCKNPILKEAPTRRLVLSKAAHGVDESAQSCLAFLVCALGHLATPFVETPDIQMDSTGPDSAIYAEAEVLFHEAQSRMGAPLMNSEAGHLIIPQCLILSGLHMMCTFRPFQAWQFFVQALAACQQFAFLRKMYGDDIPSIHDSKREERISESDSQEQAVYWTAWKSERELRRCLCLPDFPAIGDTSRLYPPLFPTPPEIVSNDSVDQRRERASWLFYLAEISLRRLLSSVCDEILSLHRNMKSEASFLAHLVTLVPEYEQQGRRWAASLPAELSLEEPAENDDICRFVLRGHYIDYCEVIYWPFLASQLNSSSSIPSMFSPQSALSQPSFSASQQEPMVPENHPTVLESRYLDVSQSSPFSSGSKPVPSTVVVELAAKCLEIQLRRVHINYPGFRHRHHGTFLLIWSCTRSALTLLAASLTGLVMPSGWRESVTRTAELLSLWKDEMPQLSKWRDLLILTDNDITDGNRSS